MHPVSQVRVQAGPRGRASTLLTQRFPLVRQHGQVPERADPPARRGRALAARHRRAERLRCALADARGRRHDAQAPRPDGDAIIKGSAPRKPQGFTQRTQASSRRYARIAINRPRIDSYNLLSSRRLQPPRIAGPASASRRKRRSLGHRKYLDLSYSGFACVADCHVPYHHRACTSVVWLPNWLPDDKVGAGIRMLSCAPTATRTRDLLLRSSS
jgi:hypothetical protein